MGQVVSASAIEKWVGKCSSEMEQIEEDSSEVAANKLQLSHFIQ